MRIVIVQDRHLALPPHEGRAGQAAAHQVGHEVRHVDAARLAGVRKRVAQGRGVRGVGRDGSVIDERVRAHHDPFDVRVALADGCDQVLRRLLVVVVWRREVA